MPDQTPNLGLPYILAAQAQKHVTHNEAIRNLDALVQLSVLDRGLTTPPANPLDGDRYIIATGASSAWAGLDGQIAARQDNAWGYYQPREGWTCWVADEDLLLVWTGTAWSPLATGGAGGGASNILTTSPNGAATSFELLEEELVLSGAFTDSSIEIPDRAIVMAVTTRTTQAITGASSYDCGIALETNKYGASLGISAGSTNAGVTGPTAFYAPTPIRITANGSAFTGGKVRLAIHYMLCSTPTS